MKKIIVIILGSMLCISGCANKNKPQQEKNLSAEEIFQDASKHLKSQEYQKAADFFAKITQEYPYSNLASKSHVMEAYSYYLKKDYDMTIAIAENFVKLYPVNPYTPYIYYLKALSYYEQILDIDHDQKITELTKDAADELISRFPESDYARDFKIKLDLINDHLAGKEMIIGRFYLYKGEILAAINRFNIVIKDYQTTAHIEEALFRLVEGYLKLGIKDEAQKYAQILGYNYPNSKWYDYAYEILIKAKAYAIKSSD
ncbi:MAG: outer membrane protein assembly factor BamD [Alphaproteobacteria bacterium]